MLLVFPNCNWKCEKDCGKRVCQNSTLATMPTTIYDTKDIIREYIANKITSAIVCAGLEPFDSWEDLYNLISCARNETDDDIVIYTGYTKEELKDKIPLLYHFKNIIIKFGRYIPNQVKHHDKILGMYLASDNQYAERINMERGECFENS